MLVKEVTAHAHSPSLQGRESREDFVQIPREGGGQRPPQTLLPHCGCWRISTSNRTLTVRIEILHPTIAAADGPAPTRSLMPRARQIDQKRWGLSNHLNFPAHLS